MIKSNLWKFMCLRLANGAHPSHALEGAHGRVMPIPPESAGISHLQNFNTKTLRCSQRHPKPNSTTAETQEKGKRLAHGQGKFAQALLEQTSFLFGQTCTEKKPHSATQRQGFVTWALPYFKAGAANFMFQGGL